MPISRSAISARTGSCCRRRRWSCLVGALGGLYPAFYLSRFEPASVLKANKSSAETPGTGRLRNVLVVAQFAVSIALIICTAVIYGQTVYARTIDPGYQARPHPPGRRTAAATSCSTRADAVDADARASPA